MSAKQNTGTMLDVMGSVVASIVMLVYAFTVVAPYFLDAETKSQTADIIKANKNTVDLITTAVVMFFFGASVGRKQEQETLNLAAKTSAAQAEVLAAKTVDSAPAIPVSPGDRVVVEGKDQ